MAAKLEGEVSARTEAKASCSIPDTALELEGSVESEEPSERGFTEVSLDNLNDVLSMIERANSHPDDVLALSCLKEAQEQVKTLLGLEGSL